MEIIHNDLNQAILSMVTIVAKGQPFAKRNKERRIRATLKDMRERQTLAPQLKDVWFYFKLWLKAKYIQCLTTKS